VKRIIGDIKIPDIATRGQRRKDEGGEETGKTRRRIEK
jgi:hypothetical protein